jgi:hypothetical protein
VTTTEEKAETPPKLFEDGELPADPKREVQPGDWFALHLVCQADGKVALTADAGYMPVANVIQGLREMESRLKLEAAQDFVIRELATEGQTEFERMVGEGMSPGAAKGVALLDIIKKIHIEAKDDESDNGTDASPTS